MASNGGRAHGQTGHKGITEERIIEALSKNAGIILPTAQALGCSRQNLEARIANSARLKQAQLDCEEQEKDIAEGVVRQALRKKDVVTARWYLERKGADRGYRNQTTHVGTGQGGVIEHAVTAQQADPVTPEEIAAARRRYFDDGDDA